MSRWLDDIIGETGITCRGENTVFPSISASGAC